MPSTGPIFAQFHLQKVRSSIHPANDVSCPCQYLRKTLGNKWIVPGLSEVTVATMSTKHNSKFGTLMKLQKDSFGKKNPPRDI